MRPVLDHFLDQIWTSLGTILGANLSPESAQERQDAPKNANVTSLVSKLVHLQIMFLLTPVMF